MKRLAAVIIITSVLTQVVSAGTITGTVTDDSNGQPIQGLWVYTQKYDTGEYCGGNSTNPDGVYSISGLAAGTYKVAVSGSGTQYASEFYDNQLSWDRATPVSVSEGGQTDNIDFSLGPGASISGVVKNFDGIGQANIQVNCWANDGYGTGTQTEANGFYECGGLPVGYNYNVVAYPPPDSNYAITGISVGVYHPGEYPGNDIVLGIGGSIAGTVRDSNGLPITNIQIEAINYETGDWCNGDSTDSNGVYEITNLAAGNYRVEAWTTGTQYASEFYNNQISWDRATPVNVSGGQQTTGIDFSLELGATISGVVKNSSGVGQANIQVNCWANDGYGTGDWTEANGFYECGGLPVGYSYNVVAYPPSDSNYAITGISVGVYQPGEYTDNDIILGIGAILCGKVLDADTAEPLAGVEIDYEAQYADRNTFTNVDGSFCLTQLPPGIAEVKAEPDVDSGYCWNLPWGSDYICLSEGENRSQRIITLEKGALVRGYIKDADGMPISIEYYYSGRNCDGWDDTDDVNGDYQIRLPVGTYVIAVDEDEFGTLPEIVTITDINEEVNVPDIIVYTEENGGQISGDVCNPGGHPKTGVFIVVAFEAGTVVEPNNWYTISPVGEAGLADAGPFVITTLPPDVNYDIYLCVYNELPDDIESLAVRDSALNVAVGTTGINLEYSSQGSTVEGSVKNTDNKAVLGAEVLLADSSNGFRGFGDTDCNGQYVIYNVPAGTYMVTAVHSKYLNASTAVEVDEGTTVDVNTIVMQFSGEKEAADLNGDANVNTKDLARFAQQWLDSGDADFNQDGTVSFNDFARFAQNWLWRAMWYHDNI